jgi:hypothetical protein
MRNSKIAILCYGLAVGFVLVVAFHSPAKSPFEKGMKGISPDGEL